VVFLFFFFFFHSRVSYSLGNQKSCRRE
jgi:hypothetical protein